MKKITNENEIYSRIDRWRIGRKKICATIFCEDKPFLDKIARKLLAKLNNALNENESAWEISKSYYDEQEKVNKVIVQHKDIDMTVKKGKFEISLALWHG